MHHARMVRRLFSYIGEGGHVPHEWFAAEVARLDNVAAATSRRSPTASPGSAAGPISRTAPTGSPDPAEMGRAHARGRSAAVSDALHERLTQRFVDRRTAVLVRDIGARGADALPVTVAADGEVSVGPEPIGHLDRLRFPGRSVRAARRQAPAARRRRAPPRRRARPPRAARWSRRPTTTFALIVEDGGGLAVAWEGHVLARLAPGRSLLEPALRTARALDRLSAHSRAALARAARSAGSTRRSTAHLGAAQEARRGGDRSGQLAGRPRARGDARRRRRRAAAQGDARRRSPHLEQADRQRAAPACASGSARSTSSSAAAQARGAALARGAARGAHGPADARAAAAGAATLGAEADPRGAALAYRRLGREWLRIDLADRLASHARKVRSARRRRSGRRRARDLARPRARRRSRG